jgi:hypothetical protein
MRVCVVYVDTDAIPVGAIISMASTCDNKDFLLEFLDLYKGLPVLWHVKVSYTKKKQKLSLKGTKLYS